MAAEIFTGQITPGQSVTYNNSTGGNVRIIINYLYAGNDQAQGGSMTVEWGTSGSDLTKTSFGISKYTSFGKSVAWSSPSSSQNSPASGQNAYTAGSATAGPTEVYLKNGDFFQISTSNNYSGSSQLRYQYVVIPE
tara:strand:- start:33 stop:440 length:408 start_codon:yes stop_codon:yes gene_type:complete